MSFKDMPIRKKLMRVSLLISGLVLLVTCLSFFAYEYFVFRTGTKGKFSTMGKIIAANSTAALAFHDPEAATEILAAFKTEPHVVEAALYDKEGIVFAQYSNGKADTKFPDKPGIAGYSFKQAHLEGFEPVVQNTKQLGTLYIKSDLGAMYARFRVIGIVGASVIIVSLLLAWFLSSRLQQTISKPILDLATTAKVISGQKNYSVRAAKAGKDEVGELTDAFNDMLAQIQQQTETLNEFNHNLEEKVADRTRQLEAANKELEAFTYSVSHDLRAPLRIIDGYADILITDHQDKLEEEGNRVLGIIKSNARRMGQLIDDLLDLSHIGRKELVLHQVNMDQLARTVAEEQVSQYGSNAHIKIAELDSVKCDSSLIRQVWINLISNAIKYSRKKENPQIEIHSARTANNIIYTISDNGVGFDMKYADKLFGVFQRLHKVSEFEGTGIGLALVNRILVRHGGSIRVEAEAGKGATFFFSLPVN